MRRFDRRHHLAKRCALSRSDRPMPELTDYLDFRAYLRDWYQARKAVESWLTHRVLAEKFALGSVSHFGEVLRGRRLTAEFVVKYQKMLGLNAADQRRFALLVDYQQNSDPKMALKLFAKLKKAGFGPAQEDVEEVARIFFADPLHPVLFNLCAAHSAVCDARELSGLLRQRFSVARVQEALIFLQKAGFLRWEQGAWVHDSSHLRFAAKDSKLLEPYQLAMLKWGLKAYEEDRESQHLGMLTLSLSDAGCLELQRRLRAFRQEIVALANQKKEPNRTVHLNLQFLELDHARLKSPSSSPVPSIEPLAD
jgi:uncharacterized protein (TIGR02147 family)